jgi:hypothetical protein
MLSVAAAGRVQVRPVAQEGVRPDWLSDRAVALLARLAAEEEEEERLAAVAAVAPPSVLLPAIVRPPPAPVQPAAVVPRVLPAQPAPGEQNPLASPHGNGPSGPRTRHQRVTIMNLEYPDFNPNDPPPEYVGQPRRPPQPALYLAYCQAMLQHPNMLAAAFQPEIAAGNLHHVQGYYADTRRKPTLGQQYVVWAFRGVPLRPWQYRSFPCDNPRGAWEYAIKGPEWRDSNGHPDTGQTMPGGVPRTFGFAPPPGEIQQGGNRNERNTNARNDPENNEMVQFAQYIRHHAMNKRQLRELYLDPEVVSKLKPTESLVQNMHSAFNDPDMTPNLRFKRRVIILCGASGSGKTTAVRIWCHKNGIDLWESQTPKDGLYGGFLQGYSGQRAALFDECDGNFVNFDTFLKLTHSHEGRFDQKQRDCVWRPEFVFITSMKLPKEWTWYIGGSTIRRPLHDYATEKKAFYRRLDFGGIYIWQQDDDHELIQPMLPDLADLSPVPNKYYEIIRTTGYIPLPPRAHANHPRVRIPDVLKGELHMGETPGTIRRHEQEPTYRRDDTIAVEQAKRRRIELSDAARIARVAEDARFAAIEAAMAIIAPPVAAPPPIPAPVPAPPVVAPPATPPAPTAPPPPPAVDWAASARDVQTLVAVTTEAEENSQPARAPDSPSFNLADKLDEVEALHAKEKDPHLESGSDEDSADSTSVEGEDSDERAARLEREDLAEEARLQREDDRRERRNKRLRPWIIEEARQVRAREEVAEEAAAEEAAKEDEEALVPEDMPDYQDLS